MSENQLLHSPTPWVGEKEPGQVFLEILFSTIQESWGIHLYSQIADCYESVFPILKEMGDQHLAALAKILEWQHDADNEVRVFNSIESFVDLDELLVNEIKLRSKLLSVLNDLVSGDIRDQFDRDHIANARNHVSSIHLACVQRLGLLRSMVEENSTREITLSCGYQSEAA